jgi:polysaccharide biosynthesis transport protein
LMLSAGAVVTGELLRMTAPHASAAFAASAEPQLEPVRVLEPELEPVRAPAAATVAPADPDPTPDTAPVFREAHLDVPAEFTEIERLADDLLGAGAAARKVTILGTASNESITLTALTLARLIVRHAKVVLVDLSPSSPTIAAVSVDPTAPGLAELMQGEASFSQIITKDRLSRVHLVSAGRPGSDPALLQSPRLTLAVDALLRVYDHVLLDAGTASDLPAELLTRQACAVVVPDPSMAADARTLMCDQLRAVGFNGVTMLSKPPQASDAVEPGPRVVAA